jgi:uncharacterized protein YdhG (YjbR/CyaY superfamily)
MERDPVVDRYLEALGEPERSTLTAWRDVCRELPDQFVEGVRYGMPCYQRDGEAEIGFAAQKRYLSLYVLRADVLAAHRHRLQGYSIGRGCVRFPKNAASDLELISDLVRATAAATGPVC